MKTCRFDFPAGRQIAGKYRIIEMLGEGMESEVYKIEEISTGIHRAAKIFYPQSNVGGKACQDLARKLHRLRDCQILIQYHNQETISQRGTPVQIMISEYIEGQTLTDFLANQRGGYLPPFQACHLLYAVASGVNEIHQRGDYHGDLHTSNILVTRYGLGFSLKLIDFFRREGSKIENVREDIVEIIRVFYDALGGAHRYSKLPDPIRQICCGLKRSLILNKFPTTQKLVNHLESMTWD